ncbi:hypothetical protein TNCV_2923331 [Trichonephila clavipes]|nr:hypothetical protein TNCV_2923331 [Trichonephila clavipes]
MMLKSATIHPFLPAFSYGHIASSHLTSNSRFTHSASFGPMIRPLSNSENCLLTYPVHYFVGPWSRCNGQGFRRIVHCQTYPEIGQTVARLPDLECVGQAHGSR